MPAQVGDNERLVRYVLTDSWLYKDKRSGSPLRPNALMPHPHVDLSVFRIDGWEHASLMAQGEAIADEREEKHKSAMLAKGKPYPAGKRTFRFLGTGEIVAKDVRAHGLDIHPDIPPPRHAIICGWPPLTGNRKHDEAGQMALALKLNLRATYKAA